MDEELFDEEKFIEYAEEHVDEPVDEDQVRRFAAFAKLAELAQNSTKAFAKLFANMRLPFGNQQATLEKRPTKHPGSKNHNKKRDKDRAKMATASNRMNRSRHRKWKHT